MKEREHKQPVGRGKALAIGALFLASIAITLLGVSLVVYSLANHISYLVLNSQIHGAVFGAVITFLGIRYSLSVQKLKREVYKPASRFSWENFKKSR